ncbi:MAG: carbohydrate ABC transporter substrate-binding protein, partial [Eubacteriales bacterium]|nr:carbohydrate ABC transporter substrate-binding protein [Eubacteriales bacterium]
MPKLPGVEGATNYSNNGGSSWAVSSNCQNKELAFDFLAKTFAGSVAFYEDILPSSGALATYLPAG